MKKKLLTIGSYVLVAMLATVITLALVGENPPSKLDRLEALIENRFIGEADSQTLEDAAAAAMVKATGDRWSYYISAKDYDAHREQEENAYVGVGITIQPQEDESGFLIIMVADGGPAKEAGIEVNDLLIGVEDQDIRGMTTDEVGALVKGEEGTKVSLTVMRKGEHMTLSVERRRIEQPVAEGEMLEDGIGLVKISNTTETRMNSTIWTGRGAPSIAAIDAISAPPANQMVVRLVVTSSNTTKTTRKILFQNYKRRICFSFITRTCS